MKTLSFLLLILLLGSSTNTIGQDNSFRCSCEKAGIEYSGDITYDLVHPVNTDTSMPEVSSQVGKNIRLGKEDVLELKIKLTAKEPKEENFEIVSSLLDQIAYLELGGAVNLELFPKLGREGSWTIDFSFFDKNDTKICTSKKPLVLEYSPKPPPSLNVEDPDKLEWEKAKGLNTLESYSNYVEKFSGGKFVKEARKAIKKLRPKVEKDKSQADVAAWHNATQANSIEAYNNYTKDFPEGQHILDAKKAILSLEEES